MEGILEVIQLTDLYLPGGLVKGESSDLVLTIFTENLLPCTRNLSDGGPRSELRSTLLSLGLAHRLVSSAYMETEEVFNACGK